MSVRNSLKNSVKYHSKGYSQASKKKKKKSWENREAEMNLVISNQKMKQLALRKTMWENVIGGIQVTSFYESGVKRVISHLAGVF